VEKEEDMPQISLAEYRHRIEEQIENGHIDEAIAHCRHVLTHYPRYLPAYKLLAHACLEKGDFSHAIHFFQCVLSADIEDADAWINLALLTEDLGETRQAIWLLERAFEVAPGNTRVRELLRQLYVQRDGAERTRIKLTPIALARLYARGGFYHRAIHELEKMLQESASLPRLQIATLEASLAQALWNTEDRTSLADQVCQSLLDKVPFSLQANLILGEIRASSGRHQESEPYLQVARMLDPEGELAHELLGHRSPLPLQEVEITYLEYQVPVVKETQPVAPEAEDTSWLDHIGESVEPLDLEDEHQAPEWIKNWTESAALMPAAADETAGEDIPELESQGMPSSEEPFQDTAEVPEWLLEVQRESAVPDTDEGTPDWLQDLTQEAEDKSDLALADQLPDWLQELGEKETAETSLKTEDQPTLQGDLPDWLLDLSETEGLGTEAVLATSEHKEVDQPQEQRTVPPPDTVRPEKTTRPLRAPTPLEDAAQAKQAEELPQWFDELRQEAETAVPGEPDKETAFMPAAEPSTHDEVPDWLRELSDEGEIETPGTPGTEKPTPVAPMIASAADGVSHVRAEAPLTKSAAENLPNWLRELEAEISGVESPAPVFQASEPKGPAEPPPVMPPEPVERAALVPEALSETEEIDWLVDLDEMAAPDEMAEAALEPAPADAIPDWLQELDRADEQLEAETEAELEEIEEAELEPMPDDELPDWLQELRAESDFAEALLPAEPEVADLVLEEESELEPTLDQELPDWLQQLRPAEESQPEQAAPLAKETEPVLAAEQAEPEIASIDETIPAPPDEMEDMEWLRELEEATIAEAPQAEPEAPVPVPPSVQAPEAEPVTEEAPIARAVPPAPAPVTAPLQPATVERPAEKAPVPQAQDAETRLTLARTRLSENALDESAQEYERLVQEPDMAGELTEELEEAVRTHPDHHALQRVLGDAYMRTGRLQKALEAYRQALKKL
jgi:tetratricopeptide (TPR) repeat protein